jgi:hypothetical protein
MATIQMASTEVLRRVRALAAGPVLLFKGAEIAARYPDPLWRSFKDIDLIASDPAAVQQALLAAGFNAVGVSNNHYEDLHHLQPLALPVLSIRVEVHQRPPWPEWFAEPSVSDLIERAVLSKTQVDGLLTLDPADHALIVAAHAWQRVPLGRARDLVDIWLLAEEAGRDQVAARAEELQIARLWRTTIGVADALFSLEADRRLPIWARSLSTARDVTVLGHHVQRWVSPFWTMPPGQALRAGLVSLARVVLPAGGGESWRAKVVRSRRAIRNALRPKLHHDREIGDEARRPPRRTRY